VGVDPRISWPAIIIPSTGWLASVFGRKTLSDFFHYFYLQRARLPVGGPSLELLVCANLQGLGGGGLQPLSQAILLETFPPKEHGMAMAVFGMGVVFARYSPRCRRMDY